MKPASCFFLFLSFPSLFNAYLLTSGICRHSGRQGCKERRKRKIQSSLDQHRDTHKWTYRITHSQTVENEDNKLLFFLMKHFEFSSASQARKASRHGEILILRQESKIRDKTGVLDSNRFEDDKSNLYQNRFILLSNSTSSALLKDDIVARITRADDEYYPVHLTGYVQPPPLPIPSIIYEDEDLAVIDKPEGLTTMGGVKRNNVEAILPFILYPPQNPDRLPQPIHRLDRRTSGLLLVAKTQHAMKQLSRAFQNRQVHKMYTALVFGSMANSNGVIDYPIDGKDAVSHWRVLQETTSLTLLQVKPETGRTHQIRCHLSYCLGTPIVGDNKYDKGRFKEYRASGLFLCSSSVTFEHPTTNQEMTFSIPIPTKFRDMLDKDDRAKI